MSRCIGQSNLSQSQRILVAVWVYVGVLAAIAAAAEPAPAAPPAPPPRIVIVKDPEATATFQVQPHVMQRMVDRAVTHLTGKADVRIAWLQLVSTQDVVGIKVYSSPGPTSGTHPAVVEAVIQGLLAAGLPPTNIIVWDKQLPDLRLAGYLPLAERYQVRLAGAFQAGYDDDTYYESAILGNLVWGDWEFGKSGQGIGRKSFVSRLVTRQMTKIINVVPLLNHNLAGVSGCLYSLTTGSVDNFARFQSDPDRLATAIPEIYALPALADHVVLNIVDATVCQYEGSERSLLHYTTVLNELWMSRDPVALDVLCLQELERQRSRNGAAPLKPNFDIYSNAALLELGVADLKNVEIERLP